MGPPVGHCPCGSLSLCRRPPAMGKCLVKITTRVSVQLRFINHCCRAVRVRVLALGPRLLARAVGALPLLPAPPGPSASTHTPGGHPAGEAGGGGGSCDSSPGGVRDVGLGCRECWVPRQWDVITTDPSAWGWTPCSPQFSAHGGGDGSTGGLGAAVTALPVGMGGGGVAVSALRPCEAAVRV